MSELRAIFLPPPQILHEDNHCFVVDKPAGLLSQGDSTGDPCLVDWAKADLKARHAKPGDVYLGLVHRLDRPVSGVVLLAKTSKAASRLSQQFRNGSVEKTYWAVVEGAWDCKSYPDQGVWIDQLAKNQELNVSYGLSDFDVDAEAEERGKEAILEYQVIDRRNQRTWVELRPRTGRGHQLRVQLASRGLPMVGDFKYGSKTRFLAEDGKPRVALHAIKLGFDHPTTKDRLVVESSLPPNWPFAIRHHR